MKFTLIFIKAVLRNKLIRLGAASFAALGLYIGGLHATDNFHEVIPKQIYRSAQLEQGELADVAHTYGIKSVLNLRGENTGSDWYDNELVESKANGITHFDFKMSSSRELSAAQALELIAMMRDAPKPLLIHCQGGADRSGLATALYMTAINKASESKSDMQLSLLYGHLPSFGTDEMCKTFKFLKPLFNKWNA